MENTGWEILPAGWIALFILGALLFYYLVKWLRRPPDEDPKS